MSLLGPWFERRSRPAAAAPDDSRPADPPGPPPDRDVPPKGSAWFESSHELMRGLLVVEEPVGWRLVPRRAGGNEA